MTGQTRPAARQHALEITRVVDAPRDVAFKIWTTPRHLARWWGPKDFTPIIERLEFREGGAYRHTIHKDDHHHGMSGVYREIVVPERIAFTFAWDNEIGAARRRDADHGHLRSGRRRTRPVSRSGRSRSTTSRAATRMRQAGANASTAWKPISRTQ